MPGLQSRTLAAGTPSVVSTRPAGTQYDGITPTLPMAPARRFAVLFVTALVVSFGLLAGQPFHGNVKTRVFHQASCRYYACPNCTAKFASAEEAKESGYRPCGVCEPAS